MNDTDLASENSSIFRDTVACIRSVNKVDWHCWFSKCLPPFSPSIPSGAPVRHFPSMQRVLISPCRFSSSWLASDFHFGYQAAFARLFLTSWKVNKAEESLWNASPITNTSLVLVIYQLWFSLTYMRWLSTRGTWIPSFHPYLHL